MDISKRILVAALVVTSGSMLALLFPRIRKVLAVHVDPRANDQNTANAHIMEAVKNKFLDPDSVKVRNLSYYHQKVSDTQVVYVICGELNAKNASGGYTGYSNFNGSALLTDLASGPYFFDGTTGVNIDNEYPPRHALYLSSEIKHCKNEDEPPVESKSRP